MLSTNDLNNCDAVIRPVVDSYLSISTGIAPSSIIVPSLQSLASEGFPLATKEIASNYFNSTSRLTGETPLVTDTIIASLEVLTTSMPNITYLFGGTNLVNENLTVSVAQKERCELLGSTLKYDDTKIPSLELMSNSSVPTADAVELTPVMNCWLSFTAERVNNLHSLMKLMAEPPAIEVVLNGSLYDHKEVPFAGQSHLDHTFIVIDEDFTKILSKSSGTTGAFLKKIFVPGDKVNILAVPTNQDEKIISFRGIDITGV